MMMIGFNAVDAYQGNDLGGLSDKSVCKLLIERDEMANVNVAVILLHQNVLAELISGRESVNILAVAAPDRVLACI